MDTRVVRTINSINNAFIVLRAKKPIEKITIKELCELASLNKATFYQHYHDIYDLEASLQREAVDSIMESIPHPEILISDPKLGINSIITAILSEERLISILFSDERLYLLRDSLEKRIKLAIVEYYPELLDNLESDILLSILIQGSFDAYFSHKKEDISTVVSTLVRINCKLIEALNIKALNFAVSGEN